jgi:hypothetical protein
MDKRLIFSCFLLVVNSLMFGQISNKIDLLVYYKSGIFYSNSTKNYKTDFNVNVPTVLGNLENNQGFYMGFLYSEISFNYQPGLVIGYNKYYGNKRLEDMYDNLKLSTTSVGFVNKYNFYKYGHYRFVPYAKLNLYFSLLKLKTDESFFTIEEWGNDFTKYKTEVRTPPVDFSGLLTTFELSVGSETKLADRFYLFFEFAVSMTHYPDFDAASPFLSEEGNILFGIQYKILKDKRFYYSR